MTTPLPPPGPDLARRNRRVLAERLNWPPGAVEECEQIDAEAPGWTAGWAPAGGMEWKREGYYAVRDNWHWTDPVPRWVYGRTPDELRAEIGLL